MTKVVKLANYSHIPGGRKRKDGPASAETFRDEILYPACKANTRVIVDMDGIVGVASSFLEEVFIGFDPDLVPRITIKSDNDPSLILEIKEYLKK